MRRLLEIVDTTRFWAIVFLAGLVLFTVYAYQDSRAQITHNEESIAVQRQTLAYLCETVRVIDVIFLQTAVLDRQFARDRTLSKSVRATIVQRLRVLETAHAELSDTRACHQIE